MKLTLSLNRDLIDFATRNVKDFRKSRVEAVNPSLFLELIEKGD